MYFLNLELTGIPSNYAYTSQVYATILHSQKFSIGIKELILYINNGENVDQIPNCMIFLFYPCLVFKECVLRWLYLSNIFCMCTITIYQHCFTL